MLKIVKDNVKSLREKSVAVDMPASEKELKLLIDSQYYNIIKINDNDLFIIYLY